MPRYYGIAALALTSLLAACASTGPAPVEDRSLDPRPTASPSSQARRPIASGHRYRVERGDTLYSIAFRHGVDYRDVAAWNGIGAPYTIYVGQELRVSAPSAIAAAKPAASRPTEAAPVRAAPTASPRTASNDAPKPAPFEPVPATPASTSTGASASASTPAASPPPKSDVEARPPPPAVATTASPPVTPTVEKPAPAAPPPANESVSAPGEVAWRWPAEGQLAGTFVAGDPTKQGIDIVGKAGDPVRAAADGSVVYSGNGLVGYGELIIIKHNPSFLSAYGHNRKRLVKEGDKVKSGQVIAEMGSSSATRDSLHFEVRRNGKPGNPLDYLPRR